MHLHGNGKLPQQNVLLLSSRVLMSKQSELLSQLTHISSVLTPLSAFSFPLYRCQGGEMNLSSASSPLRWGQEWHTLGMREKGLLELTPHHCSHDILLPMNVACSPASCALGSVKSPALFLPRGSCSNGTGGVHARSMKSFGTT